MLLISSEVQAKCTISSGEAGVDRRHPLLDEILDRLDVMVKRALQFLDAPAVG